MVSDNRKIGSGEVNQVTGGVEESGEEEIARGNCYNISKIN